MLPLHRWITTSVSKCSWLPSENFSVPFITITIKGHISVCWAQMDATARANQNWIKVLRAVFRNSERSKSRRDKWKIPKGPDVTDGSPPCLDSVRSLSSDKHAAQWVHTSRTKRFFRGWLTHDSVSCSRRGHSAFDYASRALFSQLTPAPSGFSSDHIPVMVVLSCFLCPGSVTKRVLVISVLWDQLSGLVVKRSFSTRQGIFFFFLIHFYIFLSKPE